MRLRKMVGDSPNVQYFYSTGVRWAEDAMRFQVFDSGTVPVETRTTAVICKNILDTFTESS